jgi:uncharacterized protein (TIGR00299 family) protein
MKMGRKLYLECYSGISGDMMVASLLDLGADQKILRKTLDSLEIKGFQIQISRVKKSGIDACDFNVVLDAEHENHDHDMEYLHGHIHEHRSSHNHTEGHTHSHEETMAHNHEAACEDKEGHVHSHQHRGMKEIRRIIQHGEMTDGARELALKIIEILAKAEAKAHNVPEDEVHFHEVGAVDSIVDIIAAAVCIDNLNITETIIPVLCEGQGTIRCQHGILPVPVPAVANIVQAHQLPIRIVEAQGEFVTPTGAAIAAAIKTGQKLPKEFSIEKIGIGAGKRKYERPGILRAMLILDGSWERDSICKLETNIDDCTGEAMGYVMERLFEAGARDVHFTPVFMKKNRPAWQLNVICCKEDREKMEQIIFRETTTIGIRRVDMERTLVKRVQETVSTPAGDAKVKVCQIDGNWRYYPEYESVVQISRETGLPYMEVCQMVLQNAEARHVQ